MDKKPLKPEEGAVMLEPDIRKYFPDEQKQAYFLEQWNEQFNS
ncbi:MAG: hypothetical protein AAB331_01495 [Planctomycetota bacterium]|mgnify:CR=1